MITWINAGEVFQIEKNMYRNTETNMSCELSHKNNLSRTEEIELGNRGERIVGKGPDLLRRGVHSVIVQLQLVISGNLDG